MASTNVKRKSAPVYTHEGAVAARISPVKELRRSVLSCLLWENTFYEDGKAIADRISDLCQKVSPQSLADLAIEARTVHNLRHVPLFLTVELARHGGPLVGQTIAKVIQRADELSEFLSLYWERNKRPGGKRAPLSAQVKLGLAQAFHNFDEYELAKYNRDHAVKLRDVLFLVHAKPDTKAKGTLVPALNKKGYKRGQVLRHKNALFTKVVNDTLKTPDTHEAAVGAGENRVDVFRRLIAEGKLGSMAFLKNLRFLKESGFTASEIDAYAATLNFKRVLPFRFISAAKAVPTWEPSIEKMMLRALKDVPKLPGKTAIIIDNSGSMYDTTISEKSDLLRIDAACAVGILVSEICEEFVAISFSDTAAIVPSRKGFALVDAIKKAVRSNGTYTQSAVDLANREGYDRIIVITDEQSSQRIGKPKTDKGYFINVSVHKNGIGYGDWIHIDGFSEAVVNFIREYEGEVAGK